jgi:hypothetical protein
MKLIVKIGYVYRCGGLDLNDAYFECDEEYTEEVRGIEEAKKNLKKDFNGIYDIYIKHNGVIVACVY